MNSDYLLNRIEVNPRIMFGKPIIKGSILTVELILEKLANGQSYDQIIDSYPFLIKDDIIACLLFAAKMISLEEITAL